MNKKKTIQEKGITLIALIITIVVLLILAVVAIRAVQDGGIIDYAKNARDDYEAAKRKEEIALFNILFLTHIFHKNYKNKTQDFLALYFS